MMDAQTRESLQQIVRQENLSLLSYVRQAYPWTTAERSAALNRLQGLLDAEHQALAALGQYMTRRHVPVPVHVSFPVNFTTVNFLGLEYLIPRLVEEERQTITDLERDLPGLTDLESRVRVEQILVLKRRHLTELEALRTPQPVSA
jgi:hypothetical protein